MNVKVSAHNFVAITLMAAVGLIVIKLVGGTQVGQLPLIGPVFRWLGQA